MLELQAVSYHPATAPEPLLRGVDLRLPVGEPALVAGPSGSGKTTLLELVSGLAEPSGGRILWEGRSVDARRRRWLCGLVFQFPERYFLGLSVAQELKLGQRRLPAGRLEEVLARVGLADVPLSEAPERLSGGQQRRLSLAVQLLRDPRLLLLDEPTAGLDWAVRDEVLQLLASLARERAMLIVTHEPDLFRGLVSSAWRLERGCLRTMPPAGE